MNANFLVVLFAALVCASGAHISSFNVNICLQSIESPTLIVKEILNVTLPGTYFTRKIRRKDANLITVTAMELFVNNEKQEIQISTLDTKKTKRLSAKWNHLNNTGEQIKRFETQYEVTPSPNVLRIKPNICGLLGWCTDSSWYLYIDWYAVDHHWKLGMDSVAVSFDFPTKITKGFNLSYDKVYKYENHRSKFHIQVLEDNQFTRLSFDTVKLAAFTDFKIHVAIPIASEEISRRAKVFALLYSEILWVMLLGSLFAGFVISALVRAIRNPMLEQQPTISIEQKSSRNRDKLTHKANGGNSKCGISATPIRNATSATSTSTNAAPVPRQIDSSDSESSLSDGDSSGGFSDSD